ncbi:amino acid ABC transporter permease [Catellatospora bangladeshensis]|uniref:Glutamate ABC transporter permease n=1 Tax=Catellatospora bangladeshensis TaxID=310355 RepID=A0A8J3JFB4_9ACTN|nr:amino acid ABC transporter permease [Catellatospora bangladeshensis]GIF79576.1 glutamate ABC transporter permease [Catellatospora bangladeshensis]
MSASVLYDHPGPRARMRNRVLSAVFAVLLLAGLYGIYRAFDSTEQWTWAKWQPFFQDVTLPNGEQGNFWDYALVGLLGTLQAAATAMVFALAFGLVFSAARLSDHVWIRVPAGVIVEFFRAVPVLLMIFFLSFGGFWVFGTYVEPFWSVVIGLTFYNGSVLAEAFRAGIQAVPKGQSEAAYSLGLVKSQVMRMILVPQAARTMLPVIVSQLVVVLKDTALGYIVAYPELMLEGSKSYAVFANVVPTFMVLALIYIVINATLTAIAHLLKRRADRRGVTTAPAKIAAANAAASGVGGGAGA